MNKIKRFFEDTGGDAVVEAAILFPIAVLVFAALVLASIYLPIKASLQRATQRAATAIAVEKGDTWLFFDEGSMEYYFADDKSELNDVYTDLLKSVIPGEDTADKAELIVKKTKESGYNLNIGDLSVEYAMINHIICKEIMVTAVQTVQIPIDLSFIGFPKEITTTVTSTAATQNGDEFVRNMGLAVDFAAYISEKYGLTDLQESIGASVNELTSFMGWK